jgi:NADH-quinone oxidoreductase subunit M
VSDIKPREIAALAPIMALCLLLGVYPQPVLDSMKSDVGVVAKILKDRQNVAAQSQLAQRDD